MLPVASNKDPLPPGNDSPATTPSPSPSRRPIVLIGMPGAGKSTLGKHLAERLGMAFLDTDAVIETSEGMPLARVVARHDVSGFRAIEARALLRAHELGERHSQGAVISTGGSAVYCAAEMRFLKTTCLVVHLDVTLETIAARVGDLNDRGVVRRPGQSLQGLFDERAELYRMYAHLSLPYDRVSAEVACDRIAQALLGTTQAESAGG